MPLPRREEENKEKENKKSLGIQKTTFCNDKATQWTITIYWVLVWLISPLRPPPVQIDHPRISGVFISGNCYWLGRAWSLWRLKMFFERVGLKNWLRVFPGDLICCSRSRFVTKRWRRIKWSSNKSKLTSGGTDEREIRKLTRTLQSSAEADNVKMRLHSWKVIKSNRKLFSVARRKFSKEMPRDSSAKLTSLLFPTYWISFSIKKHSRGLSAETLVNFRCNQAAGSAKKIVI